jgi:hypothetical protein
LIVVAAFKAPAVVAGLDDVTVMGQPATLTSPDHGLDGVTEKPACGRAVAQFAGALKVFPCDLEGFFKQLGD